MNSNSKNQRAKTPSQLDNYSYAMSRPPNDNMVHLLLHRAVIFLDGRRRRRRIFLNRGRGRLHILLHPNSIIIATHCAGFRDEC